MGVVAGDSCRASTNAEKTPRWIRVSAIPTPRTEVSPLAIADVFGAWRIAHDKVQRAGGGDGLARALARQAGERVEVDFPARTNAADQQLAGAQKPLHRRRRKSISLSTNRRWVNSRPLHA